MRASTAAIVLLAILAATTATAASLTITSDPVCQVSWNSGVSPSELFRSIATSSNGSLTAVGYQTQGFQPRITVFRQGSDRPIWEYAQTTGVRPGQVSVSADGSFILLTGGDAGLVFSAAGNNTIREYRFEDADYMFGKISENGRYVALDTYGSDGHVLYLFSTESADPIWFYKFPVVQRSTTGGGLTISYEGGYLSVVGSDDQLYFFSQHNNQSLWKRRVQVTSWNSQMSSNGDYLAFGQLDKIDILGNRDNGTLRTFSFPRAFSSMALSKDGSTLAAVWSSGPGERNQVSLHDLRTGKELFRDAPVLLNEIGREVTASSVGLSEHGSVVAVGLTGSHSKFTGLTVYNRIGQEICTTTKWGPGSLAVSDDGRYIVGGTPISLAEPRMTQGPINGWARLLIAIATGAGIGLVYLFVRTRRRRKQALLVSVPLTGSRGKFP